MEDATTQRTDWLLRRRSTLREQLEDTPSYLYPDSHELLQRELGRVQAELSELASSVVVYYDELEFVGDDGTLEDALERLQRRQGG